MKFYNEHCGEKSGFKKAISPENTNEPQKICLHHQKYDKIQILKKTFQSFSTL